MLYDFDHCLFIVPRPSITSFFFRVLAWLSLHAFSFIFPVVINQSLAIMAFKTPMKRAREPSHSTSIQNSSARSSSSHRRSYTPALTQSSRFFKPTRAKRVISHPPTSRGTAVSARQQSKSTTRSSRTSSVVPRDSRSELEDEKSILDREENDDANEVIMAIDLRNRDTVGCCYYVAREEKLYFMGDVKFGGMDVIDTRELPRKSAV